MNKKKAVEIMSANSPRSSKHYNNGPAENLSEEMQDAKGQFDSSSDLTFTENWMIAEGDKVAVCFTAKGTHDGVFQGVPATGKHYELAAMTVWRFVDGRSLKNGCSLMTSICTVNWACSKTRDQLIIKCSRATPMD